MPVSLCNYCFYQSDVQQVMSSKGCSKHAEMKIRFEKKKKEDPFLQTNFLLFLNFSKLKAVMQWKRALLCREKSHKENFVLYQYLKYANMISSQRPKIMLGMNS